MKVTLLVEPHSSSPKELPHPSPLKATLKLSSRLTRIQKSFTTELQTKATYQIQQFLNGALLGLITRGTDKYGKLCISLFLHAEKGTVYSEPQKWMTQGLHDPGVFKLGHLQSTKPIFT